jgi:lysophospholipase L1-like esterase
VAILDRAAARYAKTHPDVVVLVLGTNDALHKRSTKTGLAVMQTMVSEFRGACMVGITLPEHATAKGWSNVEAHGLNVAMRKWANQVVDWASMSATSGILRTDGIHTTPKGTKVRADAIIAAVKQCAEDSK